MTLCLVSLSACGNGDEIAVVLESRSGENVQRERLVISSSDFADLGLRKGEITPDGYDAVLAASARHSARKRALAMLGFGRCSAKRLSEKLAAKGVDRGIARETVARLASEGYLHGNEDALRDAEKNAAKLWGRKRIAADLRAKGYETEEIRWALDTMEEDGIDYAESCAERLRRSSVGMPDDPSQRQKVVASLMRAGFSLSEIREATEIFRNGK